MNVSDLDYFLPKERIAQFPAQKRDESRLLVYRRSDGSVEHRRFAELDSIIPPGTDFVRNDAAVLKARIFAKRPTGGAVECLLLSPAAEGLWRVMLRPGKKLPEGSSFGIDGLFEARVEEKFPDGQALVKFSLGRHDSVIALSEEIGAVPLPPYIERDQRSPAYDRRADNERYETVYADPSKRVAAAAPTAGLHFTDALCGRLEAAGSRFHSVTLHVGLGTFQPIKGDSVENHRMHSEIYEIPAETAEILRARRAPITMVGTTSLRASEDFCRKNPELAPGEGYVGSASLFVHPPQRIVSADALITNFHLPRSTLMCLVGAFISPGEEWGIGRLKEIYALAISEGYRFFSYGDAMLIL